MAFNFKPLVNVRTQKDEFADNVIATSVVGTFRFPPKVATRLDIADYDAVSLFYDVSTVANEATGEPEEVTSIFIAKGHNGTIKRDDEGNIVTGSRNTTEFEESDPMDGAIVRNTTADSKILSCTSAATWKMLGGGKDRELVLSATSIGTMEYPLPSGKFVEGEVFQLQVVETRILDAKEKKDKESTPEQASDSEVQDALNTENLQEEEV